LTRTRCAQHRPRPPSFEPSAATATILASPSLIAALASLACRGAEGRQEAPHDEQAATAAGEHAAGEGEGDAAAAVVDPVDLAALSHPVGRLAPSTDAVGAGAAELGRVTGAPQRAARKPPSAQGAPVQHIDATDGAGGADGPPAARVRERRDARAAPTDGAYRSDVRGEASDEASDEGASDDAGEGEAEGAGAAESVGAKRKRKKRPSKTGRTYKVEAEKTGELPPLAASEAPRPEADAAAAKQAIAPGTPGRAALARVRAPPRLAGLDVTGLCTHHPTIPSTIPPSHLPSHHPIQPPTIQPSTIHPSTTFMYLPLSLSHHHHPPPTTHPTIHHPPSTTHHPTIHHRTTHHPSTIHHPPSIPPSIPPSLTIHHHPIALLAPPRCRRTS
jgi:hypothetical protein